MAEQSFVMECGLDKSGRYERFVSKLRLLVDGISEEVSVLANVSAALKEAFGFFWVGFYIVRDEELVLGPFQGSVACYRIRKGRGVCGTAWAEGRTLVVPDVDLFPGHIACSSLSRSEIVVPVFSSGSAHEVRCVLDIDSDVPDSFDETDRFWLEKVAAIISENIY